MNDCEGMCSHLVDQEKHLWKDAGMLHMLRTCVCVCVLDNNPLLLHWYRGS